MERDYTPWSNTGCEAGHRIDGVGLVHQHVAANYRVETALDHNVLAKVALYERDIGLGRDVGTRIVEDVCLPVDTDDGPFGSNESGDQSRYMSSTATDIEHSHPLIDPGGSKQPVGQPVVPFGLASESFVLSLLLRERVLRIGLFHSRFVPVRRPSRPRTIRRPTARLPTPHAPTLTCQSSRIRHRAATETLRERRVNAPTHNSEHPAGRGRGACPHCAELPTVPAKWGTQPA